MAKVIKPFPYSKNGIDTEHLVPGDERDFGRFTDGLVKEGFVEKISQKPAAEKETKVDEAREAAVDAPTIAASTKNKPQNRK